MRGPLPRQIVEVEPGARNAAIVRFIWLCGKSQGPLVLSLAASLMSYLLWRAPFRPARSEDELENVVRIDIFGDETIARRTFAVLPHKCRCQARQLTATSPCSPQELSVRCAARLRWEGPGIVGPKQILMVTWLIRMVGNHQLVKWFFEIMGSAGVCFCS